MLWFWGVFYFFSSGLGFRPFFIGTWTVSPHPRWKLSRLFPVPAGTALVRDVRILHGGTPNVSAGETQHPNDHGDVCSNAAL